MRNLLPKIVRDFSKRFSKSVIIDRLWIGADDGATLGKIRDALAIIQTHDSRRYSRLSKDLKGIFVNILPGALGQYTASEDFCDLDQRFVTGATPDQIASVIVHEATHARLWLRGIRYDEAIRARVEHVCIRQERLFAARLPEAASQVEKCDRRIAVIGADFYSDKAWSRRRVKGVTVALRHLGMPRWLISVLLKVRRMQVRRLRRQAR